MSVELNSMASSPNAVTGTEGQNGKGKVKSGADAGSSANGGFAAILTSIEPPSDQGVVADTQTAETDSSASNSALVAADTELKSAETPQSAVLLAAAPIIPLVSTLPTDLAMLLEQAGKGAGAKLSTFSDESPEAGAKGGVRLIASTVGADKSGVSIAAFASFRAEKPGDFKQNATVLLDQMAQGVPAQAHKAKGAEFAADAKLGESRALKLASLMDVSVREPAFSGALVASGMGDSLLRQADKAVVTASVMTAGSGVEGIWGQQALQAGSHVDAPAVMADPSMPSLESKVADTVNYWVTQGVQNAQLKLDGFGAQPVEVSISLKGDEAHIGFRTDQPEIRQMLEGSVAHLTDLLTSEGLVLSGVSVGASSQDGAGAQEQRQRPEVRQAIITTTDVVSTERRQWGNQSVGRAVDLFV